MTLVRRAYGAKRESIADWGVLINGVTTYRIGVAAADEESVLRVVRLGVAAAEEEIVLRVVRLDVAAADEGTLLRIVGLGSSVGFGS